MFKFNFQIGFLLNTMSTEILEQGQWGPPGPYYNFLEFQQNRLDRGLFNPVSRVHDGGLFCLFGFHTSSGTRLYREGVLRLKSDNFMCCHT